MITFEVQDMSCGHCVSTITKAVLAVDQGAQVAADLAMHRVRIEPSRSLSDKNRLSNAIREAGYTPVLIDNAAIQTHQPAPCSRCCCR